MTDKVDSFDGDTEESSKFGVMKFNNFSKPVQIALVGLLVGFGLIGFYLVGIGVNNMMEPPHVIANGVLPDNPAFSYKDVYYTSDKRNELTISNNKPIDAKTVWIGTPIEYESWRNMKLMDGKTHEFRGNNGKIDTNGIKYITPMRYYYSNTDVLNGVFVNYKQQVVILIDNDKTNATIYEADIKGDVTSPIFSIVKTDDRLQTSLSSTYATGI